ncbi:hypothetical protein Pcinc_016792 [Petrolisthes cinctipes]|uniref:DDE-1 domain-containing protein n=1 Tax=Petrolisthes cinctipes TaxID=88211 RepID=A0AAE1FQC6_PETCI|nr:hypothetical protein Pcinc_016792 [Petrolisthes cinctipes]
MQQMADVMDRDKNLTAPAFWKSYTIKDAIANISRAWNSVPESALVDMDEPLTAVAALEIAEMAKENDDDEESTENPAEAKKEMTIPKLKNFMQNINAAIECAIQDDHDMERSMQVGDALRRAASTYSNLLEKMVMAQQQRTITSFFRPLTPPETSSTASTSGETSRASNSSGPIPPPPSPSNTPESDVDNDLLELDIASDDE